MNEWDDPDHPGRLISRAERVGVDALRMSRVGDA
jgi:hypothetical protein